MNINKKYAVFLLLGILFVSPVVFAEEGKIDTDIEVKEESRPEVLKDIQQNSKEQRQPYQNDGYDNRRGSLQKNGDVREVNSDSRVNLREEARLRIQSGELKPAEAYKKLQEQAKVEKEKTKAEIKKLREDFQKSIQINKDISKSDIEEKREGLILGTEEKRNLFKEEYEAKKDEMKTKREALKATLKSNLSQIKDEVKKAKVETIAINLNELNVKITDRATEMVTRIETVLVTIESRTDKAAANKHDVAAVRVLITSAETAIAEARVAITTQVSKTYPITILSETTAKASLKTARDLLKTDISLMKTKIKAAHEATRKAAQALNSIAGVNDEFDENEEEKDSVKVESSTSVQTTN